MVLKSRFLIKCLFCKTRITKMFQQYPEYEKCLQHPDYEKCLQHPDYEKCRHHPDYKKVFTAPGF